MKESKITVNVSLDENNIPEKLHWEASDGAQELSESKAAFLSFWDLKSKETLKIDLWTKDMPIDQMNVFFHQTLVSMSDTYFRSTNNEKMTDSFKQFCDYFAENLNIKLS